MVFSTNDRNILGFKPRIEFIEPDQKPGVIEGINHPQLRDAQEIRDKLERLAENVSLLAELMQRKIDNKIGDFVIANNSNDGIQAMRRRFPNADPTKITYAQYRACKENLILKGVEIGKKASLQPVDFANVQAKTLGGNVYLPGGLDSLRNEEGANNPADDERGKTIPELDIEKLTVSLICILVNYIWKEYIKVTGSKAGFPIGPAFSAMPDELCNPGVEMNIPGLLVLGKEPDDLLKGKVALDTLAKAGMSNVKAFEIKPTEEEGIE